MKRPILCIKQEIGRFLFVILNENQILTLLTRLAELQFYLRLVA